MPSDRGFYHRHGTPANPGRDYVFSSPDALWSFGHGMSYTTYAYSGLQVKQESDSVRVFVDVTNTGGVAGKAVPQLYVRDIYSSVATPVKQLKAFDKVLLRPGERARAALHFAVDDLALTNENGETKVEPGDFELQIGESSDSILLRDTISIGSVSAEGVEAKVNALRMTGRVIKLAGVVRDVQATPVEGVEVCSMGMGHVVAVTDKSGKYNAEVVAGDVLVFRKGGFIEEQLKVEKRKIINVKMRNK